MVSVRPFLIGLVLTLSAIGQEEWRWAVATTTRPNSELLVDGLDSLRKGWDGKL
jgi:hypothetical protein